METIDDLVRKIREYLTSIGPGERVEEDVVANFADRTDKAYKLMVEGLNDGIVERDQYIAELTDNNSKIIAELNEVRELNRKCCDENERLKESSCTHMKDGHCELPTTERMREIKKEDERFKNALQPVLAVGPSSFETHFFKGGEWSTPVYDWKLCEAAVLEAQRIWKEGKK